MEQKPASVVFLILFESGVVFFQMATGFNFIASIARRNHIHWEVEPKYCGLLGLSLASNGGWNKEEQNKQGSLSTQLTNDAWVDANGATAQEGFHETTTGLKLVHVSLTVFFFFSLQVYSVSHSRVPAHEQKGTWTSKLLLIGRELSRRCVVVDARVAVSAHEERITHPNLCET